jgi:N-acetylmuramoyl-L-alanine amidase
MKRQFVNRQLWVFAAGLTVGGLLIGVLVWSLSAPAPRSQWSPDPLSTAPEGYDWSVKPAPEFPIPPYARFLEEATIVIDPGHIGQRDPGGGWKRGPTGLREAVVNLRVAQFLREFLAAAGAKVVLTREMDRSLDLPDEEDYRARADVANALRADLFLSVHHNAADNDEANFTTVFYHGRFEDCPASLSAARFLLQGINDALRLETHIARAVLSDYAIYPGRGFAVLRHAEVPAVLTEASFHSHAEEEARLRDPVYNRREAYGLFLGLARWAQAGLPRVALAEPETGTVRAGQKLRVVLDNGLSHRGGWGADLQAINPASLVVRLDGEPVAYEARLDDELLVRIPRAVRGRRTLYVDFENLFGQHVIHPRLEIEVARP